MSDKNVSEMTDAESREMAGAASPADELRKAAKLMREHATSATPGPWRTAPGNAVSGNVMAGGRLVIDGGGRSWPDGKAVVYGAALTADAEYIASMHPAVALAVADWLEHRAGEYDGDAGSYAEFLADYLADRGPALAVARAYLQTTTEGV